MYTQMNSKISLLINEKFLLKSPLQINEGNYMSIHFVSIESRKDGEYAVVEKSFPKIENKNITISLSKNQKEICKNKELAEIAAKKFAELNKCDYIQENTSVF